MRKTFLENISDICGGNILHGRDATAEILSDTDVKTYFDGSSLREAAFRITRTGDTAGGVLSALEEDRRSIAALPDAVRIRFGKITGKYLETGEYSCSLDFSVCYTENGREGQA